MTPTSAASKCRRDTDGEAVGPSDAERDTSSCDRLGDADGVGVGGGVMVRVGVSTSGAVGDAVRSPAVRDNVAEPLWVAERWRGVTEADGVGGGVTVRVTL